MDISSVAENARRFRDLHRPGQPLVLFNVWDAVSARIVEQAGYRALATGSAAVAWTQGFPDGEHISRKQMLEAVSRIVRAVAVPVSADLEAAYGLTVRDAAATARGAIEAGAAGLNFEDTGEPGKLIDLDLQCERIEAMVETGARLGVPLVINARTDVFIAGGAADAQTRMEEAIRRGNRFLQAGAGCVFVLGVSDEESIARLAREIKGPLNVFATAKTPPVSRLAQLGVARVSIGPAGLAHALAHVRRAAQRLREEGTFEFAADRISGDELNALFVPKG
ncbi:MAG TPA: isocitrate lyase/phosphoenolpyruvate mutase family protein [Candidatus Baltobacteraceae bacterium]|nr:isocitrate lyase/phosphoenolpyruvate mutase family protein [Candidatus Baltobacteraceae bacterium]